jgi:very-short-patch-repair endonuclease
MVFQSCHVAMKNVLRAPAFPLAGKVAAKRSDGGGEEDAESAGLSMMAWNRESSHPPTRQAAIHASHLRRALTDAEKLLWNILRREAVPPAGTHFRRQMAIGAYVVDFACLSLRLIVEVDGEVHSQLGQAAYDAKRDAYLRSEGFRVIRFLNSDVLLRRAEVIHSVNSALAVTTPTPSPSPQGGGEQ